MFRFLVFSGIVVLCALSVDAMAQDTGKLCVRPGMEECPRFYENDCRDNRAFREANTTMCLNIIIGMVEQDEAACAKYNPDDLACTPVNCDDDANANPLRRYYCENGHHNCPVRLRDIEQGFTDVLTRLSASLEPYNELIELDIGKIPDQEQLCQYTPEALNGLLERSNADNTKLESQIDNLQRFRSCSKAASDFMSSGRPPDISEQLWQGLIARLDEALKNASETEGAVTSKLEQLQSAPDKLMQLRVVHEIGC